MQDNARGLHHNYCEPSLRVDPALETSRVFNVLWLHMKYNILLLYSVDENFCSRKFLSSPVIININVGEKYIIREQVMTTRAGDVMTKFLW